MAKILSRLMPAKWRNDDPTIPVVRLQGMIAAGGSAFRPALNLANCASQFQRAFSDKSAPAVAIVINSPGGSPVQSRLIYKRIRDLAVEKKKKVHVFVEDAAASGGYMIACAGDDIIADPSSIVGSIGVVSAGFGFVEAIDKLGIERRVHTAGLNKSVLDPFLPEKEHDIERLKALQLEIHGVFIDLVKESRGDRLADDDDLFTGLFWVGENARKLGLVDEIGDIRATLKAKYGPKTRIKLVEAKRSLFGNKAATGIAMDPSQIGAGAAEHLFATAEEKNLWARLGL